MVLSSDNNNNNNNNNNMVKSAETLLSHFSEFTWSVFHYKSRIRLQQ